MKLTQKLLGYLNRVFDKDPRRFLAFRLDYAGTMTWQVEDQRLKTVCTAHTDPPQPQSTNHALWSRDFTNAVFTKLDCTVTGNATTSVRGDGLAESVLETATTAFHYLYQSITGLPANVPVSISVKVKPNSRTRCALYFPPAFHGGGAIANFDLTGPGAIVNTVGVQATITALTGGWYQLTATSLGDQGATSLNAQMNIDNGSGAAYLGDVTKGLYVDDFQVETGPPTKAIDTTSAKVTRAAEATRDLDIDLTGYTLSTLTAYLSTKQGYTVTGADLSRSGLSARVLMDGDGSPAQSNGNALFGYTSLLWAFMEAVSVELKTLRTQADEAPKQLDTVNGSGIWLDEIGSYYGVTRKIGESDAAYGPRIIAESLQPRGNNVAIAKAVELYINQPVEVIDVVALTSAFFHDGTLTYNSAQNYNTAVTTNYGLFDITYAYDPINGDSLPNFLTAIRSVVDRLRDGGTHLRSVTLTGSQLSDEFGEGPEDIASALAAIVGLTETFTAPTDTALSFGGQQKFTDDRDEPTEVGSLSILAGQTYDGEHEHNGYLLYNGGGSTTPIEG